MAETVDLGDFSAEVIKKDIKNVHLSVYPPDGRVRISAPKWTNIDTIRAFAISRARLDQAEAAQDAGAGTRDPARIPGPREPLRWVSAIS